MRFPVAGVVFVVEEGDQVLDLLDSAQAGSEIEVKIDDRQDTLFGFQLCTDKAFFAERGAPEGLMLCVADGKSRQQPVAVSKGQPSFPPVVDTQIALLVACGIPKHVQQMDAFIPVRILIDLLKRNDIRIDPSKQMGDTAQVTLDPFGAVQALVGREPATMGDVERQQSEAFGLLITFQMTLRKTKPT